jgi:hypothetical protein
MKANEIKTVIQEAIRKPLEMPSLYIWGGPGIGKSSVVKQAAQEEGVDCLDIRLVLLDATDLRGIPVPENGKAKWLAPSFLPTDSLSRGVAFLDELNCAAPLVQASGLQLVLDRRIGEYTLPDGWCIVAAGNREMEAFVHRMSPPLSNRFVHLDFDIDSETWATWAIQNNVAPQIIGLLTKFRPELIYKFSPEKKAWPSPRSWAFASKILKNGLSEDLKFELIKGCVGEGAAIELRAYQEIWSKLPDLDAIIEGKDSTIPKGVDLIYACCVGLVSKASKPSYYNHLLEYALKLEREYSVFLVKMLYAKNKEAVVKSQKWAEFAKILVVNDRILS